MITKELISQEFQKIQNDICSALSAETGQDYLEDRWDYQAGDGGGITRIFQREIIEKGGVNFSSLSGTLSEKMAGKLKGGNDREFYATGLSLVIHPVNPFIPTIHMNIRYLERGGKQWFGGGIDLTPYYINKENIILFHQQLKMVCVRHSPDYYPKFKKNCDDYFYIKHREEARGVGGIFFDYLSDNPEDNFEFVCAVGRVFNSLYIPLIAKYKNKPFTEKEKDFQLFRRGRYVEFNLVYDRGTLFGLETKGRIESILMSLPPEVKWNYDWQPEPNSTEAELVDFLKPRNWTDLD